MGLLKRIMVESINVDVWHNISYARNKLDIGSVRVSITEVDGEEMKLWFDPGVPYFVLQLRTS